MIKSTKYHYTQYFLHMLCPPDAYYELIKDCATYLDFHFQHESHQDGILEQELEIQNTVIVLQYHPHLGIHVYLNSMEDATPAEEQILEEVAKKIHQLV